MKMKIVSSSELQQHSLRARDYIYKKYKVTYTETIECDVVVEHEADNETEFSTAIADMDDADQLAMFEGGKQTDMRVLSRSIRAVGEVQ